MFKPYSQQVTSPHQTLPQEGSVSLRVENHGSHHHKTHAENMAISNFHIQMDGKDRLYPGEELVGKVVMDVWSTVDVRKVEFIINGIGTVRVFQGSTTFVEKPRNEVYISKRIQLIGPQDGGYFITLKPGRYVSSFRYVLPETIPPTVHQFEMGHGYVFDISYNVQANVCDSVSARYMGSSKNLVKIIKAVRRPFVVLPTFDWRSLPGAKDSVMHSEQISLMCSPLKADPTSVKVFLDRVVFPVGDSINIKVEVFCPEERRVRHIMAELEQQLTFSKDMIRKFRRIMVSAMDDRTMRMYLRQSQTLRSQFKLPIPKNLVPSYIPNCKMVGVAYSMKVTVSFKKFGGKLLLRVPLLLASAIPEEDSSSNSDVPVFDKPIMQFPYFSKSPFANGGINGDAISVASMATNNTRRSSKSDTPDSVAAHLKGQITTKYEPSIHCAACCLACLGVGIYDT